ncbi:hypothetical protein [Staphylococcus equorum]|uniref:hypothetical protein n=1 Tax=Staphylococcus equorum TaxID=246432 RepID=UPI00192D1C73|nr:hypothetical protein [Staphylococcus equorum]
MKKLIVALSIVMLLALLTSCSSESKEDNQDEMKQDNNENQSSHSASDTSENQKENTYLEGFNAEEIEYARIWYQLRISNYNVDASMPIYVTKISKGSKVNPQSEESAVYKEDVTTLASSHRAIGSITYSSNGDGTINLYKNVPYKWESPQVSDYSKMGEVTKNAIENNIETLYVKPWDNQDVSESAKNINYTK